MDEVDVLIAGAGPAGCAAAVSLAQFAPSLSVCLVDGADAGAPRIGETVAPPIEPILHHLALWDRFIADCHLPSHRTLSAWGTSALMSNEFLFHVQQVGWRLDRARFDAMMVDGARAHVSSWRRDSVVTLAFADGVWRTSFDSGKTAAARFVVDATGRRAALMRAIGLRSAKFDRLVGCFVEFADTADDGEGLLIEAEPDGWWYTAAIPGGRRVVAYMSDSDLARTRRVARIDSWTKALRETRHVSATVASGRMLGPPRMHPAGSCCVDGETALPIIAVGDAASCFDPISGQGIIKALRSGIFASYAVGDFLCRDNPGSLARYRALATHEFAAYRETLADYYAVERRWAARAFWQRRHAMQLQTYAPQ